MDDLEAIRRLGDDYALLMDRKRFDDWALLFTPDAELSFGRNVFRGRDEIKGMAESAPTGIHIPGPTNIAVEGDTATLEQSFLFLSADPARDSLGFYEDQLVRTADGWRFAARRIDMVRRKRPE